jgi:AcrR family transcriptional regulator
VRVAAEYFGEHGYEDTKWADVATAVGIGSTALYHYFESKLHCLYVIMADAIESFQSDFDRITAEHDDFTEALLAVLRASYEVSEHDVLRLRVLVAEFLARGMEQGIVPETDPRLLTRALLGLYNSVWHWYRPRGTLSLSEVGDFFIRRQLSLLGLSADLLDGAPPPARGVLAPRATKARR